MYAERDRWFIAEILPLERELLGYLRGFFGGDEVRDIVQQTYAQLCAMDDYRRIEAPRAFLFTTARNICVQRIRHERVLAMDLVAEMDEVSALLGNSPSVEEVFSARQELAQLMDAISLLPERCRQVFTLRKVYGYSQREIAQELGIAENTVEAHIQNGVRQCADYLLGGGQPKESAKAVKPKQQPARRLWRRGLGTDNDG